MSAQEQIANFADILVPLEVELDRKIMSVRSILRLEQGSVIQLERSAGENIDILIGGAVIASGEIVVLEDSLGIRITDFVDDI